MSDLSSNLLKIRSSSSWSSRQTRRLSASISASLPHAEAQAAEAEAAFAERENQLKVKQALE